jgi:hypothetical protein
VLNKELGTGEDILGSFVKYKTQAADIGAVPTACTGIEELDVTILIEAEFQSLRNIVNLCRNNRVG